MNSADLRLELLRKRHSVRSYLDKPVEPSLLNKLKAAVTMVNSHEQGMRFQIVTDDSNPFHTFNKSYGVFENVHNYIAAVVDVATPGAYERAGYFAQQIVVRATELGLGTCYVGATYDSSKVKAIVRAGEKILFLILFGYPANKQRFTARIMVSLIHLKRMDGNKFFVPAENLEKAEKEFPELRAGLEAVACAPSAVNRRPARIFVDEKSGRPCVCACVKDSNPSTLIDLGIAKYNYNFATSTECEWGNGAPLSSIE